MRVRGLLGLRARHFFGESKSPARTTRKTGNTMAASHPQAGQYSATSRNRRLMARDNLLGRQQHPSHLHPCLLLDTSSFPC